MLSFRSYNASHVAICDGTSTDIPTIESVRYNYLLQYKYDPILFYTMSPRDAVTHLLERFVSSILFPLQEEG